MTEDLIEGWLDGAIGVLPNVHRLLRDELLFEEEYVLLIPEDHAWARRTSVCFEELRDRRAHEARSTKHARCAC